MGDVGILVLRVVVGLIMAAHGAQKLFGWFKGPGIAGTSGFVGQLGFRGAPGMARLAGTSEFFGGILLALGLLTPLAAAAIIGMMVTAIGSVHWTKGFFNSDGGYEFNLALIASALAVAIAGPGVWSFDNALGWQLEGIRWGIGALIVGTAAAAAALASRRQEPAMPQEEAPVSENAKAA